MATEKNSDAEMKPSSKPALRTTTIRAKRRAKTAIAARVVMASVTPATAEPGACPDIAIQSRLLKMAESAPSAEEVVAAFSSRCCGGEVSGMVVRRD